MSIRFSELENENFVNYTNCGLLLKYEKVIVLNTSKKSNLREIYGVVFDDLNVAGESTVERIFVSEGGAKTFMRQYFAKKEKASALRISKDENNIFSKSAHTVSVFCLGYYLRNIVKEHVLDSVIDYRKTYFKNVVRKDWFEDYGDMDESQLAMEFEFLWFMTALYHDISAAMEKCDRKISWSEIGTKDIFSTIDELKTLDFPEILLNPYKLTSKEVNDEVNDILLTDVHYVDRMTFSEKDVTEYFNYCLSGVRGHQSINHGIIAGYLLFSKMVSILKSKFQGQPPSNFRTYEQNLFFERTDIFAYQMAADAIIAHNIWFAKDNEDDENFKNFQKYACKKQVDVHCLMKRFIYDREKDNRLSIKKNPLGFWLGLMDTIEPFKHFIDVDKMVLLNVLSIYTDGMKRIEIGLLSESHGITTLDLECWCREIKMIEIWLKVNVVFDKGMICIDVLYES